MRSSFYNRSASVFYKSSNKKEEDEIENLRTRGNNLKNLRNNLTFNLNASSICKEAKVEIIVSVELGITQMEAEIKKIQN